VYPGHLGDQFAALALGHRRPARLSRPSRVTVGGSAPSPPANVATSSAAASCPASATRARLDAVIGPLSRAQAGLPLASRSLLKRTCKALSR